MVMAWSIKARTMSINVKMCGGSGVVPDDDDDEDVIRTTRA
jgi:hypothetical protein